MDQYRNTASKGRYWIANLPKQPSLADIAYGTGWPEMDEIIKFYPGQFVVVTGLAGSGKSTFMLNVIEKLCLQQTISGAFVYVPENERYLVEKLRMMWPGNEKQWIFFTERQCQLQTSVPEDWEEPFHDIEWILKQAEDAVIQDRLEFILLDPWNEFDRRPQKNQLMTDYVGQCLMKIKQFCRKYNVTVVMIAHPTKNVIQRDEIVISLADIEGSMNWYNKCDNGLVIYRNMNTARVVSDKVREIGAGKRGQCHFNVDPATGKFDIIKGMTTDEQFP
jgi:twinkle protein